MKKYQIIFAVIGCVFSLLSCTKEGSNDSDILFPNVSLTDFVQTRTKVTDLLDDYTLIPLETSDECLVGGRFCKIIKSEGHYFIKSMNEILVFDNSGRYERKLSRMGNGAQEYNQLLDFDIVEDCGEIWVSSLSGILRYKLDDFQYLSKIPLSFFANKIKYVGNDKFLALTPDDKVFNLCSVEGKILDSYYDKDLANSGQRTVQFVKIREKIVSGLADSNTAVCYDAENNLFSMQNIIPTYNDKVVTTDINRLYYDRYGEMDFSKKVMSEYVGIVAFREVGNSGIISFRYPGIENSVVISKGTETRQYTIWPEDKCIVENDLTSNADASFLLSFADGDSEDSFIFLVPNDNPDLNPLLLDVKQFK